MTNSAIPIDSMKQREPLHIAYLVQQFPPEVGAGPARVTEMAMRWLAEGSRVTVITGMPNRPFGRIFPEYRGKLFDEENWQGIRVLRSWLYASPKHGLARTLVNNTTFMVTAATHALLRAGRPDVLIASSPPFFPHISGVLVGSLRRIPLVLELRDLWPDYLVGMGVLSFRPAVKALFALERALLRRSSHVVVVTESFRCRVVDKGVAPDKISVIPNGVETDRYYPAVEAPPLDALVRRGDEFIVGYLGNIGAGQGLSSVLDAAAALAASGDPVRVVIAGDGPERQRVVDRARELGLMNVSIHPPIPKAATRAFYNACDVCLVPLAPFPILQETVPSKLFEVMACARPVIACLGGEGARIVKESGGGLVVPPGDPLALTCAIRSIVALSPDERARMGERARSYVARHYNRDVLAARYLDVLRAVAQPAPRSPEPDPALVSR